MPRKSNARVRRSRQNNSGSRALQALKSRRFNPPSHPPSFMSRPWYNLVVRLENPPALITTQILATALSNQLGVSVAGGVLNVRLQSIRIWGALASGNSPLPPINVLIFDLFRAMQTPTATDAVRVLEQITDFPDQVNRSCVGYRYDLSHRELSVWMTVASAPTAILSCTGLGPNSVAYFDVLWRCGETTPT